MGAPLLSATWHWPTGQPLPVNQRPVNTAEHEQRAWLCSMPPNRRATSVSACAGAAPGGRLATGHRPAPLNRSRSTASSMQRSSSWASSCRPRTNALQATEEQACCSYHCLASHCQCAGTIQKGGEAGEQGRRRRSHTSSLSLGLQQGARRASEQSRGEGGMHPWSYGRN